MLPFAAQGAGMAIEDAAVLARCVAEVQNEGGPAIAAALQRYARERRPRVARVQRMAKRNAAIYHLSGPAAFASHVPEESGTIPRSRANINASV